MQKTPLRSAVLEARIAASDVMNLGEGWLLDGEIRQLSPCLISTRRFLLEKLTWFLAREGFDSVGTLELRKFLSHVTRGHESPEGRWGDPKSRKPVRARTVRDYHGHLRAFFRWVVAEGYIEASPLEPIAPPIARADQVQPFTEVEVRALLAVALRAKHPRRDEAIMLVLLDTGIRASELCALRQSDLDMQERRISVVGKGNKRRAVYFGRDTARALFNHLRDEPKEPGAPLFRSERGTRSGEALTRSGLAQLIERAGVKARLEKVRCSPHTFRHTMAVCFLRNGGQAFALKELLGHTDLKMTNRYVALAQADLANQHRRFSPVDGLRNKK